MTVLVIQLSNRVTSIFNYIFDQKSQIVFEVCRRELEALGYRHVEMPLSEISRVGWRLIAQEKVRHPSAIVERLLTAVLRSISAT
ncbi:MAG: hypothetical protein AAFQ38_13385 [Pseudomonadota bacterium]